MRSLLIAILLSTTIAAPALAQSRADDRRAERDAARAEREAARTERNQPADAASRPDRPQREERQFEARQRSPEPRQVELRQPNLEPRQNDRERGFVSRQPGELARPAMDRAIERGRPSTHAGGEPGFGRDRQSAEERWEREGRATLEQRREQRDSVANWRQEQRDQVREARQDRIDNRQDRLAERQGRVGEWARPPRVTPPPSARPDVPAPPPPTATATKNSPAPKWATHWRGDNRYNWRDYRRRNWLLFQLGLYLDPFGWSYNRWTTGWRLWPSYYHRSYWLDDPWMYRLPYAPYPYKWVRYWNDALLVDTFTGRVVDVEYDFFW